MWNGKGLFAQDTESTKNKNKNPIYMRKTLQTIYSTMGYYLGYIRNSTINRETTQLKFGQAGTKVHAHDSSTGEMEAGRTGAQSYP